MGENPFPTVEDFPEAPAADEPAAGPDDGQLDVDAARASEFSVQSSAITPEAMDEIVEKQKHEADELKKQSAKVEKPQGGGCGCICWLLILMILGVAGYAYAERSGMVATNYFEAIDIPGLPKAARSRRLVESIFREPLKMETPSPRPARKVARSRLLDMA